MALADVTPEYVDLVSNSKYASRTSNSTEFEAVRNLQLDYLNTNADYIPDSKFNRGLALLICHHYALDDTSTPDVGGSDLQAGVATTQKVGELTTVNSLPYMGTVKGTKMYLMKTVYGIEFLYLMRTFKSSIITT